MAENKPTAEELAARLADLEAKNAALQKEAARAEELAAKNAALQKEAARAEELAAKNAALQEEATILRTEKVTGKNDFTGKPVEGTLEVSLEQPDGKIKKQKVGFVPGTVWCRVGNGEKVWSEDLMALANGATLSKEAGEKSPELVKMDKKAAADWIATLARRGATFLRVVGVALLLLLFLPTESTAQYFRNGHLEYFDLDTLTNAATVTLAPTKTASAGPELYTYAWQVVATNISGTTAGSIIVEESLFASGNYWYPVDTVAISAAGNYLATGQMSGIRQRVRVVGTGTQSSQLRVAAIYRRKEF